MKTRFPISSFLKWILAILKPILLLKRWLNSSESSWWRNMDQALMINMWSLETPCRSHSCSFLSQSWSFYLGSRPKTKLISPLSGKIKFTTQLRKWLDQNRYQAILTRFLEIKSKWWDSFSYHTPQVCTVLSFWKTRRASKISSPPTPPPAIPFPATLLPWPLARRNCVLNQTTTPLAATPLRLHQAWRN